MIVFKLWRAVTHPPRKHPLFQYTMLQTEKGAPRITSAFLLWMFFFTGAGFCWTVMFDWLAQLLALALLLVNTTYSGLWAVYISGTLTKEQADNRYDLLAALPVGRLGSTWAVTTGCLHRRASFVWVPFLIRAVSLVTLLTLLAAMAMTLFMLRDDGSSSLAIAYDANLNVIPHVIIGIGLVIAFFFDHVYSAMTGVLLGMLASSETRTPVEAQMRALLGFAALQLTVYALCAAVVLGGLPDLSAALNWTPVNATLAQVGVGLALFIALREALIRLMWRAVIYQLNAAAPEASSLLEIA